MDTFYYTFSTMPQVLAGAIALVGAFVLFKISQLDSQMLGIGEAVLDEFERAEELKKRVLQSNKRILDRIDSSIKKRDVVALREHLREITVLVDTPSYRHHVGRGANRLLHKRRNIIRESKLAVGVTAFTILVTLGLIPLAEEVRAWSWGYVYGPAFFLFGVSLILSVRLVIKA